MNSIGRVGSHAASAGAGANACTIQSAATAPRLECPIARIDVPPLSFFSAPHATTFWPLPSINTGQPQRGPSTTPLFGKLHARPNKASPAARQNAWNRGLRGETRCRTSLVQCNSRLCGRARCQLRWAKIAAPDPDLFQLVWQRDAVDQDHGVDLEPARI